MIVPGQRHPFKRPVSGRNPEESPAAFGPGSSFVAPAGAPLPGLGHRGPNSGETPRPRSLRQSPVVAAAGLFAACWLCFLALDALLRRRPEHIDFTGMNSLLTTCAGVAAVVLGTLSVVQWRAFRLDRSSPGPARPWGIVAAGLAQAALALVLVPGEASVWALGAHVLALVGILCGLMMGAREFSERAAGQQSQLIESVRAASTDAARRQARLVLESGHRHDLRSALFVIDGAASALVERSAELDEADRLSVGRLVAAGVGHLSGLIETCIEEIQPVAVDRLAMAVAHSERRSGMAVASDVPQGLTATGRAVDLGVVLRILLRSTAAATEGPVKVRGETGDGTVTLFVEPDGGPAHCRAAAADWKLVPFDRPG